MGELIDTNAAARMLGIRAQTLTKWRHLGCGPKYVKYGDGPRGTVRYRVGDVRAFAEARTFTSTTEQQHEDRAASAAA